MPQARSAQVLRFGVFEVNLLTRELRKHGIRVRLSGQPFAILAMLLENPGEVLTREEMRDGLWASDTFVDFEHSLNSAIKKLRAALGDSPENSRFVETLPRVGYRFVAPVEEVPSRTEAATNEQTVTTDSVVEIEVRHSSQRRWPVLAGIAAILIAAMVGFFEWSHSRVHPQTFSGRLMLAVLPFENLTGDTGQEYFSDGLTEEMIARLGQVDPEHLGVIARTSVMHYKHGQEQLMQVSRELGVQYVLEGSVRRDSDSVRITAELIQMKDQTRVWARQYDRQLSSLLALQAEIAQEIAGEIQLTLGNDHTRSGVRGGAVASPASYEAYDLYLKGRYFWNKRTLEGFQRAIGYFQQAIEKDAMYARAYAGLADSYSLMSGYAGIPPKDLRSKAHAAAQRAVELDEQIAEAHTSRALVAQNFDWDWQTAEKEYRRAIELDPNYATAHHWYAEYLALMGRFDEAFAEIERARQLDPLSLIIEADRGAILYYSRQYDRAIEQFRAVQDMDPSFPRAALVQYAYDQKGMYAESLAEINRWRPGSWYWANLAHTNGLAGRKRKAQQALEELQKLNRHTQVDSLAFCLAYIGMNHKEQALASLQKAFEEHSTSLTALKVDPVYDPLRSDPRFQDLLRRVGLDSSDGGRERTLKPR